MTATTTAVTTSTTTTSEVEEVFLDGIALAEGADYTVSGTNITLTQAAQKGQVLVVRLSKVMTITASAAQTAFAAS